MSVVEESVLLENSEKKFIGLKFNLEFYPSRPINIGALQSSITVL
jgi:hypothetical protein